LKLVYVLVRPFAFSLGSRNKRPINIRGVNLKCNTDCRLLKGMFGGLAFIHFILLHIQPVLKEIKKLVLNIGFTNRSQ